MKGPDLTLILQQQLDVANETNRILLARIDDLGRTIEELRAELSISNLKREELMATVTSMQKALLERDTDLSKQKRINKGLSKLVANKSEKHKPANGTEDVSENNTTTSSSRTDTAYITKERGNNGAKRKEHFNIETVVEEIFPAEKDFDPALASLIKYRDSISYEYIPGKFIKRIRRQYFYSQNGTVYSGKLPAKPLFNSNYDGSFIAGMAQLRYMYTMPVERIVKLFGDNGFDLPKPTAHNLLKKRRHFWTTFTRPCAWLFYRTNIWDAMRLMPKCSCKKPAKMVCTSRKVMYGWPWLIIWDWFIFL